MVFKLFPKNKNKLIAPANSERERSVVTHFGNRWSILIINEIITYSYTYRSEFGFIILYRRRVRKINN